MKNKESALRDEQLSKILGREIALILESLNDARLNALEVTNVETRPGGSHFLILYGPPKNSDQSSSGIKNSNVTQDLLDGAKKHIRSELAEALNLKRAPTISFLPDPIAWSGW